MKKYVLLAVLLCTAINATFALDFYDEGSKLYYRTLDGGGVEVNSWNGWDGDTTEADSRFIEDMLGLPQLHP